MTVTRGVGLGEAMATAQATGDVSAVMASVPAGQVVTLASGDAAYIPANVAGEIRNEGQERAVRLAILVLPPEAMTARRRRRHSDLSSRNEDRERTRPSLCPVFRTGSSNDGAVLRGDGRCMTPLRSHRRAIRAELRGIGHSLRRQRETNEDADGAGSPGLLPAAAHRSQSSAPPRRPCAPGAAAAAWTNGTRSAQTITGRASALRCIRSRCRNCQPRTSSRSTKSSTSRSGRSAMMRSSIVSGVPAKHSRLTRYPAASRGDEPNAARLGEVEEQS